MSAAVLTFPCINLPGQLSVIDNYPVVSDMNQIVHDKKTLETLFSYLFTYISTTCVIRHPHFANLWNYFGGPT